MNHNQNKNISHNAFNFKIISLNVRSLRNHLKRKKIFQWIREKKLHIVCLQETFVTNEIMNVIDSEWDGDIYHSPSDSSPSRGVLILFEKTFSMSLLISIMILKVGNYY